MINWYKLKIILLIFIVLPSAVVSQTEICDNGIDDDNDGQIDLNDEDCICEPIMSMSLIPNSSFEELDCCPENFNQLACAKGWIQASQPTTDFFHTCGFLGTNSFPVPQPFPDGEGVIGFRDGKVNSSGSNVPQPFWKEYAGACLINPLLKDSTYRFQFDIGFVNPEKSPPIDISFFGTSSCDYLPFGIGDDNFGCPSNSPHWFKLGEVRVSGGPEGGWVNSFISATMTQDIYAIAIGPSCAPVHVENDIYYYLDNLYLVDLNSFALQVSAHSHPCKSDFFLSVPFDPDLKYQWYLEGVALIGEVFPELSPIYGDGKYQVRIIKDANCRVSALYDYVVPTYTSNATTAICSGDSHELASMPITTSGLYIDSLNTKDNCDSIVFLQIDIIETEYITVEASAYEGEYFEYGGRRFMSPGEYSLKQETSSGCDRIITLRIGAFNVYIPNVFSPNGDGINDTFTAFSEFGQIKTVSMKIFDSWGKHVFEGDNWDGSDYDSGVFVYLMNIEFASGGTKSFVGSLTLMK